MNSPPLQTRSTSIQQYSHIFLIRYQMCMRMCAAVCAYVVRRKQGVQGNFNIGRRLSLATHEVNNNFYRNMILRHVYLLLGPVLYEYHV